MNENEKKLFEGFVQKTLNLDAEAMASLYNAEGEFSDITPLVNKDAERVLKFKSDNKAQHDRGFKEGASKLERELKEKYDLDSELIGVELVDQLIEAKTTDIQTKFDELKKSKLKDDDFEKHPKFTALKVEHEKQLKAKDKEWEDKLDKKEAERLRKETFDQVWKLAEVQIETEFVMPDNPARVAAWKDVVKKELELDNYRVDNETIVILDKDGKPVEDAHGKLINYKDKVSAIASKYLDVKVADARGNAGNQKKPKEGTGGNGQMTFKNRDEQTEAFRQLDNDTKMDAKEKSAMRIKIGKAIIEP